MSQGRLPDFWLSRVSIAPLHFFRALELFISKWCTQGSLRWPDAFPSLSSLQPCCKQNPLTVHELISATTTQSHHDCPSPFTGPHCSAWPNLKIKTFEAIIVTDCVTRHLVQQVPILPTACKCYQNGEIISSRAEEVICIFLNCSNVLLASVAIK